MKGKLTVSVLHLYAVLDKPFDLDGWISACTMLEETYEHVHLIEAPDAEAARLAHIQASFHRLWEEYDPDYILDVAVDALRWIEWSAYDDVLADLVGQKDARVLLSMSSKYYQPTCLAMGRRLQLDDIEEEDKVQLRALGKASMYLLYKSGAELPVVIPIDDIVSYQAMLCLRNKYNIDLPD
jgi:hypothetical protein